MRLVEASRSEDRAVICNEALLVSLEATTPEDTDDTLERLVLLSMQLAVLAVAAAEDAAPAKEQSWRDYIDTLDRALEAAAQSYPQDGTR
jgi:hypothetical protein